MKFKNQFISFQLPGHWDQMRLFYNDIAWGFVSAQNSVMISFGLRVICENRLPHTKRYLELEDTFEFSSDPVHWQSVDKTFVCREMNKQNVPQWSEIKGKVFTILVESEGIAIRVRANLLKDAEVVEHFSWLDTFQINKQAVFRYFKENESYILRINDFMDIYREMLGLNEDESLLRLESATFNFRDKTDDVDGVFFNDHTIYGAFWDVLQHYLRLLKITKLSYDEDQELLKIFYDYHHGDVAQNSSDEWKELKKRFEDKLNSITRH